MTFLDALHVAATAIALFAAILCLFAIRPAPAAARYLALFLTLYATTFAIDGYLDNAVLFAHGWIVPIAGAAYFALGPAVYLYTRTMTGPAMTRRLMLGLAIWPAIGLLLGLAWTALAPAERMAVLAGDYEADGAADILLAASLVLLQAASFVVTIVFLILSIRLLSRHALSVRDFFSNVEDRALAWLRNLLLVLLVIWALNFASSLMDHPVLAAILDHGLIVTELAALVLLAVNALAQEDLFQGPGSAIRPSGGDDPAPPLALVSPSPDNPSSKYARSALDPDAMTRIEKKLEKAMRDDGLATDPTLTLADLSRHVGVQQSYVSQTLSQHMQTKFYDFVARHRIEIAKDILASPDFAGTVIEVAYDVGFNSKSTFNAAFRRLTAMTPSEFRRKVGQRRA